MDDEAAAAAGPPPGSREPERRPYAPPHLTSYGSLPVDTGALHPFTPGSDFLGYQS
ncbi:MAG TPA: hypothetical protein VF486_10370 [Actinomycetes bacterium]